MQGFGERGYIATETAETDRRHLGRRSSRRVMSWHQMPRQKRDQLADPQVAIGSLTQLGHQVAERKRPTEMVLKLLAEDDGVDRGKSQVGEEPGLGSDLVGVFSAFELLRIAATSASIDWGVGWLMAGNSGSVP